MMYAESLNSLIIYGGELKDNKINDDGIYLYNVDDKEYKKINLKGSDMLGCRAYHSMHLNDTSNKIYIIGGIDNNKKILNDIIEIEVKDKEKFVFIAGAISLGQRQASTVVVSMSSARPWASLAHTLAVAGAMMTRSALSATAICST